jgi:thiol:disulfide interchange protein
MNKTRKELGLGALLFVVWLLLKILPRSGFLLWLLLIAAIALVVIGLLPENVHKQVIRLKDQLFGKLPK